MNGWLYYISDERSRARLSNIVFVNCRRCFSKMANDSLTDIRNWALLHNFDPPVLSGSSVVYVLSEGPCDARH